MKGFKRKNQFLSLCGLNCGLCPMRLGKHCGGCGNGNQSCAIARCSLEQGDVEYCYECKEYPCEKYLHIDEYDSFITHLHQKADLEKASKIGTENYNLEQKEKIEILNYLLANYNDGRRKTFFCIAVNLLDLPDIREILRQIEENYELSEATEKERGLYVVKAFQDIADKRDIKLKLRKK